MTLKYGVLSLTGRLALLACAAAPAASLAQPLPDGCRRAKAQSAAEGALIGGVAGAVVGSVVAGRRDRGAGVVVGGVTGAVVGASAAAGGTPPCPDGYERVPPPPRYAPPPPTFGPPPRMGEVWWGAPSTLYERIGFLRNQIRKVDEDGWLSPRERDRLLRRLDDVARQDGELREHDGGYLTADHAERLNDALVDLGRHMHWDEYAAAHPPLVEPPR